VKAGGQSAVDRIPTARCGRVDSSPSGDQTRRSGNAEWMAHEEASGGGIRRWTPGPKPVTTSAAFGRPPDGWADMTPEQKRAWALDMLRQLLDEPEDEVPEQD
jgi:hypothetical protein